MLTGLSQRVAYFYPTGVTLLHTSSPSSLRAWLRAVAWTWVCIEVTWASVARRGLFWHGARFHQPWGGTKSWQEEYPCAEPRFPGRGAPVVAWQGKKSTEDCSEIVFLKQTNRKLRHYCKASGDFTCFLCSSGVCASWLELSWIEVFLDPTFAEIFNFLSRMVWSLWALEQCSQSW